MLSGLNTRNVSTFDVYTDEIMLRATIMSSTRSIAARELALSFTRVGVKI